MSRIWMGGGEGGHVAVDGFQVGGAAPAIVDVQTAVVRSGNYAYRFSSGTGGSTSPYGFFTVPAFASGITYNFRAWIYLPANPPVSTYIVSIVSGWAILLTPAGVLSIVNSSGSQIGVTTTAPLNQWFSLEVGFLFQSAANDTISWAINGTQIGISTQAVASSPSGQYNLGFGSTIAAANVVMYMDDIALNEDNSGTETGPPSRLGKIIAMRPTSIVSRGEWTGGAGGTTLANMVTALSNRPPLGTAAETDTTQVESLAISQNNELYAMTDSFTASGIVASDTLKVAVVVAMGGEDVSTGTKTAFLMSTNPVINGNGFNVGNDVGALGTFPTNWARHISQFNDVLSLDRSQGAGIRINDTDTTNRVQSFCFLALMLEYLPSSIPSYTRTAGQTAFIAVSDQQRTATQTACISVPVFNLTRTALQTAKIRDTLTRTALQSATIVIPVTLIRTAPQAASVLQSFTRTASASAALSVIGQLRTAAQTAAITVGATLTRTAPQSASVLQSFTRTAPETGRLSTPSLFRLVPETGRISTPTLTRLVNQSGAFRTTSVRQTVQSATLLQTGARTAAQDATVVLVPVIRTIPQTASILVTGTLSRTAPQSAKILQAGSRLAPSTARVAIPGLSRAANQQTALRVTSGLQTPQSALISVLGIQQRVSPQGAVVATLDLWRQVSQDAALAEVVTLQAPQAAALKTVDLFRLAPQDASIFAYDILIRIAPQDLSVWTPDTTLQANQQGVILTTGVQIHTQSVAIQQTMVRTIGQTVRLGIPGQIQVYISQTFTMIMEEDMVPSSPMLSAPGGVLGPGNGAAGGAGTISQGGKLAVDGVGYVQVLSAPSTGGS